MKKIFIFILLLLSFNLFTLEKGEIIFDSFKYSFTEYNNVEIKKIYYTVDENTNEYNYRIMFYEKISGELFIAKAKMSLDLLIKEGETNISIEDFKNGNYTIILKEWFNNYLLDIQAFPIFIYSDKKNNYRKIKSFDNIKELNI